jgi:hypothetical protein
LEIGVGNQKLDSLDACLDHSIDRVAAASPDADYFYVRPARGGIIGKHYPALDFRTLVQRHYSCLLRAIVQQVSDRANDTFEACRSQKNSCS